MTPELDQSDLELVLSWHLAHQVLDADFERASEEQDWLHSTFPVDHMVALGLLDESGGATDAYYAAVAEALVALPDQLDLPRKTAIVNTLLDATLADDEFHRREAKVLLHAARTLALTPKELGSVLDAREEVGEVEISDTEDA